MTVRVNIASKRREGEGDSCGLTCLFCQTRIAAMKTSLLSFVMLAGLATFAFASPVDTEIKNLEQQWFDAYMKADTAALGTIEADDWTFVDSDGRL